MTTDNVAAEEKLKALREDFEATKNDLQEILLDIRAYILEAYNPMRWPRPAIEINEGEEAKEVSDNGGRQESPSAGR